VRAELTIADYDRILRDSLLTIQLLHLLAEATTVEEILNVIPSLPPPKGTFAVRSDGPDRQELQERVGGAIKEATGATVNLTKPETMYILHDDATRLVLGIRVGGELGKRHYKIITGPFSLSGPVAASVLEASGWDGVSDLVTWPCATGELAIEAVFRAYGKSPRAYERKDLEETIPVTCRIIAADPRLPLLSSAQKNAKIAGVEKRINFSRQDLDWLDTKHHERNVSTLVGILPNLRHEPKFVSELYYQLDFILRTNARACFVCVNDESADLLEKGMTAAERTYRSERTYVWSGQHPYTIVTLFAGNKRAAAKKTLEGSTS
jgi:23S rRNA G2445 N2-methylase RlmL